MTDIAKPCSKCRVVQPLSMFKREKRASDLCASRCKACDADYRKENKERISKRMAQYYVDNRSNYDQYREANRESRSAVNAEYYRKNKERINKRNAKYREANLGSAAARQAKRRGINARATPPWLSYCQLEQMRLLYIHARECTVLTGDDYHVDHIVPLNGRKVCGLHVPWNLQILPADINQKKKNKFEDW